MSHHIMGTDRSAENKALISFYKKYAR